jgi:hypothetical protein
VTLTDTEDGLSELLGTSHILLLMTRPYKGYVLERQAELKQGRFYSVDLCLNEHFLPQ